MIITTKSPVLSFILYKWWVGGVLMSVKEGGGDHGTKWEGSDSYTRVCMIQTEADRCLENPSENEQNYRVPSTFV